MTIALAAALSFIAGTGFGFCITGWLCGRAIELEKRQAWARQELAEALRGMPAPTRQREVSREKMS